MIPFPNAMVGRTELPAGSIVLHTRVPAGDMQSGSDRRIPAGDMNSGGDARKAQETL
jgi:hypothetical protein